MSVLGDRIHLLTLRALEYPRVINKTCDGNSRDDELTKNTFEGVQTREYRELVRWLENRKIRLLKIDERERLFGNDRDCDCDDESSGKKFEKGLEEYLLMCGCDLNAFETAEQRMDFLINIAIAEEYRDLFNSNNNNNNNNGDDDDDDDVENGSGNNVEEEEAVLLRKNVKEMDIDDDGDEDKDDNVNAKRTKLSYSRFKPQQQREREQGKERKEDGNDYSSKENLFLLADLKSDTTDDDVLEDEETYDALRSILDAFDVQYIEEEENKGKKIVRSRLVKLCVNTLERFVEPFVTDSSSKEINTTTINIVDQKIEEEEGMEKKKKKVVLVGDSAKLSASDYILRGSGIEIKDPLVQKMVSALRVMYVNNLRETQNRADDILLKVQSKVADPRTNVSRGKVGR